MLKDSFKHYIYIIDILKIILNRGKVHILADIACTLGVILMRHIILFGI